MTERPLPRGFALGVVAGAALAAFAVAWRVAVRESADGPDDPTELGRRRPWWIEGSPEYPRPVGR